MALLPLTPELMQRMLCLQGRSPSDVTVPDELLMKLLDQALRTISKAPADVELQLDDSEVASLVQMFEALPSCLQWVLARHNPGFCELFKGQRCPDKPRCSGLCGCLIIYTRQPLPIAYFSERAQCAARSRRSDRLNEGF